jgi:hypothetical protein
MKASEARRMALSFPQAHEAPHFELDSFRIKGRIFATLPPDGVHLHVFVDDQMREMALVKHADCVEPLVWGGKVVGVRLDVARAGRELAYALLANAWKRKAGKRLGAEFERQAGG